METVQGYVILKAATFETGHGFALGHNPGAPSPFVTWQFTEGENGHRDYYWGQGYVILKAATFETGHGFALGHNPGAPSPFVTWQFTEGENGHRDYYWGRYGTSQAWAQRDFDRRVDDYQQFYHAAVKHTELGPEGVYRYYSTQRPVDIGTYPKPPDNQPLSIVNYDDDKRRPVADGRLMAWGELTYAKPLTEKQMEDYELKPAPGNPDRVRPSITARLKDETRGQEPPKEPGQKRNHKNHEER